MEINDNNEYINDFAINQEFNNKDILRIKYWYNLIKKIPNYQEREKELYLKVRVNTKLEKILFEIKRIYRFIDKNFLDNTKLDYLIKYYEFIINTNLDKIEYYCDELINLIIETEIVYDMKIGLYSEFINYYEQNRVLLNNNENIKLLLKKNNND